MTDLSHPSNEHRFSLSREWCNIVLSNHNQETENIKPPNYLKWVIKWIKKEEKE